MKTLDSTKQEIIERLDGLTQAQLDAVLRSVEAIAQAQDRKWFTPQELLDFFGKYSFTQEEADEMERILKEVRSQP